MPPRTEKIFADIAIVGGGLAGLTLAARLGVEGFRVVLLEKSCKKLADPRTTTLLQPALKEFAAIGIWPQQKHRSMPVDHIEMVEAKADIFYRRNSWLSVDFDSAHILGDNPFGYNIENEILRSSLKERIDSLDNVKLMAPVSVGAVSTGDDGVHMAISGGQLAAPAVICTQLAVAADGANSYMRTQASIKVSETDYGQRAILFTLRSGHMQRGRAYEIMGKQGEVITLVPTFGDRYASIFLAPAMHACELMALSAKAFAKQLPGVVREKIGDFQIDKERVSLPCRMRWAHRIIAPRLALIAEAAHSLPPIGAQGLNLSLGDIGTLTNLIIQARSHSHDVGAESVLTKYQRRRMPDILATMAAVDALNRAGLARSGPLRLARSAAFGLMRGSRVLRYGLMKAGMRGTARSFVSTVS